MSDTKKIEAVIAMKTNLIQQIEKLLETTSNGESDLELRSRANEKLNTLKVTLSVERTLLLVIRVMTTTNDPELKEALYSRFKGAIDEVEAQLTDPQLASVEKALSTLH